MYCNTAKGGPSHGHRKFGEVQIHEIEMSADKQTNRQINMLVTIFNLPSSIDVKIRKELKLLRLDF